MSSSPSVLAVYIRSLEHFKMPEIQLFRTKFSKKLLWAMHKTFNESPFIRADYEKISSATK